MLFRGLDPRPSSSYGYLSHFPPFHRLGWLSNFGFFVCAANMAGGVLAATETQTQAVLFSQSYRYPVPRTEFDDLFTLKIYQN